MCGVRTKSNLETYQGSIGDLRFMRFVSATSQTFLTIYLYIYYISIRRKDIHSNFSWLSFWHFHSSAIQQQLQILNIYLFAILACLHCPRCCPVQPQLRIECSSLGPGMRSSLFDFVRHALQFSLRFPLRLFPVFPSWFLRLTKSWQQTEESESETETANRLLF